MTLPEREEGQESDSNFGFQDQRKAIKWVRENIHHFGGDPERITIYGQSAGAVSTTAHMGKFLINLKMTQVKICPDFSSYKIRILLKKIWENRSFLVKEIDSIR